MDEDTKKTPTKKHTNYKQGLRNLPWTLRVAIGNLIGSKYLCFTIKVINIYYFTTATTWNVQQE